LIIAEIIGLKLTNLQEKHKYLVYRKIRFTAIY